MKHPLDREWTQDELREHVREPVRELGLEIDGEEEIPQGVKYISYSPPPLTENEREWAMRMIQERGWEKKERTA